MNELISNIEKSIKFVSINSKYVKINYGKIDELLKSNKISVKHHWLESNMFGIYELGCRDIINFLLFYHTVGLCCFWGEPKWTIDSHEYGKLDGSYALMFLLLEKYKMTKNFDMTFLEFKDMLKGNVEIPLLEKRYESLIKMNQFLNESKFDFYDRIKHYNDDISLLNYLIENFDYLKDECEYEGEKVYFYKRAQLFVSDILHVREKLECIDVDYSHLVGCADYKIPQVLNSLNILEYTLDLENLIEDKKIIESGDMMEIEIRANTLVVIDYIYKKLNMKVTRIDINDYIWLLGQDKIKIKKNYHRTITMNY